MPAIRGVRTSLAIQSHIHEMNAGGLLLGNKEFGPDASVKKPLVVWVLELLEMMYESIRDYEQSGCKMR